MILYHGSLEIVESPKILEPNRPLDFGSGFYTTSSMQQARKWVKLRTGQQGAEKGFVSQYEFTEENDFKMIVFDSANSAWVDFVHSNRTIPDFNHDYDIVKGPVANDNVYLSFNLYESGIISKAELIARLKTYKLVDQFLFHTPQSLSTIKFVGYKEVKI